MTPEEKAFRLNKIGASDVAGVLGMSPWATPYETYLVITGQNAVAETPAMRMGKLMEPLVLKMASETHDWNLIKPKTLAHPNHPWAIASPDSLIVVNNPNMRALGLGKPADHAMYPKWFGGGVEVKNVGWHQRDKWGEPGTDQVPVNYLLQCMWGMAITNLPVWHLVAMMDNQEPTYYVIPRDDELIGMMLERAEEYYARHIDPNGPRLIPEAGSLGEAVEQIKYRVRQTTGDLLPPDEVDRQLWEAYQAQSQAVEAEVARFDDIKNTMRLRTDQLVVVDGVEQVLQHDGVDGLWRYKPNKDSPKTDWKAVVMALPQTEALTALVADNTETKPGARPLNIIKPKEQK